MATPTYIMNGCCHVNVKPSSWIVETQVCIDEQTGTRSCCVATILHKNTISITIPILNHLLNEALYVDTGNFKQCMLTYKDWILHVRDGGSELGEMQLRTIDNRKAEVARCLSGLLALHLPLFVVGHVGRVVLSGGDTLCKILILS